MTADELLQAALGILPPWSVSHSAISVDAKRVDIHLDFAPGSMFACPECGVPDCNAYDTRPCTWRHLNLFEHETYLHARTPRANCLQCGVHLVKVPWARPGSGFTLFFEAFAMRLVQAMPVRAAARLLGVHDTLLWRIVTGYVEMGRNKEDHSGLKRVGIDETSARRGHDNVSLFVDLERRKVAFVAEGKSAATIEAFAQDLKAHGGDPQAVTEVSIDMSKAFIRGVTEQLPNAEIAFDKFHAVSLVNDAVDEVRRQESKTHPELAGTRYIWLKNEANLTDAQAEQLARFDLSRCYLKTARAHQIRLAFQDLYRQPPEDAEYYLKRWYFWATHSRIELIVKMAQTIRLHQNGILRWFTSHINNGILEGINSLVQAVKAKARGYRSFRNFASIIYLVTGKLDLTCQPT